MATNSVKLVLSLKDNASKALKKVGNQASKTSVSAKGLGSAFAAVGAASLAAGTAFIKFGQECANVVNSISDVANTTGIAVDTVQDLQLMARSTGLDIQTMERALYKFNDSLSEATTNAESAQAKAFKELGLDPTTFKDSDEALRKTMEAIDGVANHSHKTRLTMELMGAGSHKVLKTMQKDFKGAAYANDLLDLRMGDTVGKAGEMQTALALQAQTMDVLKLKAFEAFTGEGGFSHGVSIVTGILSGLIALIDQLATAVGSFFQMLGYEVQALYYVTTLEFDQAEKAMMKAGEELDEMVGAVADLGTLKWMEEGVKTYVDFQEALEAMSKDAEKTETELADLAEAERIAAEEAAAAAEQARKDAAAAEASKRALENKKKALRDVAAGYKDMRREILLAAAGLEYHTQIQAVSDGDYQEATDRILELKTAFEEMGGEIYDATGGLKWTEKQLIQIGDAAAKDEKAFKDFALSYYDITRDQGGDENYVLKELEEIPKLLRKVGESAREGQGDANRMYQLEERAESLIRAGMLYNRAAEILKEESPWDDFDTATRGELEDGLKMVTGQIEEQAEKAQRLSILLADLQSMELHITGDYDTLAEEIKDTFSGLEEKDLLAALALSKETGQDLVEVLHKSIDEAWRGLDTSEMAFDTIEAKIAKIDKVEGKMKLAEDIAAGIGQWASIAGDFIEGDLFGASSTALTSTGNPYAMAAGAAMSALGQVAELGALAQDKSIQEVSDEIVQSAEDQIENFEKGIDVFAAVLPELLQMIIVELPGAIIKAIPEIMLALIEAFSTALREFWGWIKGLFGKTDEEREARRERRHEWASNYLGDFWESWTGDNVESYATGTPFVGRTGMALLHRGEAVVPANGTARQGIQSGGAPVNINISASVIDRDVIPRLVREIERATSKYGRMKASFA